MASAWPCLVFWWPLLLTSAQSQASQGLHLPLAMRVEHDLFFTLKLSYMDISQP